MKNEVFYIRWAGVCGNAAIEFRREMPEGLEPLTVYDRARGYEVPANYQVFQITCQYGKIARIFNLRDKDDRNEVFDLNGEILAEVGKPVPELRFIDEEDGR